MLPEYTVKTPLTIDVSTAQKYAEWLLAWFNIDGPVENALLISQSLWERRR